MKISVIIPTYKPGEYIWDCFDSLQNQSCSLDSFEVIVVLNGEKEPYYERVEKYLKKTRLHFVLVYTDKKGVSNARNIGIGYVKNEQLDYILFLDDDDMLSTSFIADCLRKADHNHIVVCNCKTFVYKTDTIFGEDYITRCYNKNKNREFNTLYYMSFFSSACAKLIPLRLLGDTRFSDRFSFGEDSLFGLEVFKKNIYCILSDEKAIYYRRLRIGSASRTNANKIESINNNFKLILAYSCVFFKNPADYSFLHYLFRLASEVKCVIKTLFER